MNAASSRDFRNLRREDLLDDYLKIALSRKGSLVATALRTKSISMRKIFIHGALRVPLTDSELRSQILTDTFDPSKVKNVQLLGDLGRGVRRVVQAVGCGRLRDREVSAVDSAEHDHWQRQLPSC